jgi:hypothetical protein
MDTSGCIAIQIRRWKDKGIWEVGCVICIRIDIYSCWDVLGRLGLIAQMQSLESAYSLEEVSDLE